MPHDSSYAPPAMPHNLLRVQPPHGSLMRQSCSSPRCRLLWPTTPCTRTSAPPSPPCSPLSLNCRPIALEVILPRHCHAAAHVPVCAVALLALHIADPNGRRRPAHAPARCTSAVERSEEAYVNELRSPLSRPRARCRRARTLWGRKRPAQHSNKLIRSAISLLHRADPCYQL